MIRSRKLYRACLGFLLSITVLIILFWLLRASLFAALGNALVENDGPQKADEIVVLGGDDYGSRIVKAAQLVQAGYAPEVLVSGPPALLGNESDLTIEYARRQGYPLNWFHPFPNQSSSTREETALIGSELKRRGARKILLVTSNYHTRRAARLFRQQEPWLQVAVIPAPDKYFKPDSWWQTRGGQKQFFFEATKTIATWLGD